MSSGRISTTFSISSTITHGVGTNGPPSFVAGFGCARSGAAASAIGAAPIAPTKRRRVASGARVTARLLQGLEADPLRPCGLLAEPLHLVRLVVVIVAGVEHHLRIALEREDVGGDP